ncbi:MAG: hypothetical protein AB1521_06260 [Bacteroidota bacterium]
MLTLGGCVITQEGGPAIYEATASTELGKEFVKKNNVKYICEDAVSIFFADIYRSDYGIFATDVTLTNEGKIQYRPISRGLALLYGLEPKFSWWNDHGIWLAIPLVLIMFILGALIVGAIYRAAFG